jgi:hypothetical protein
MSSACCRSKFMGIFYYLVLESRPMLLDMNTWSARYMMGLCEIFGQRPFISRI